MKDARQQQLLVDHRTEGKRRLQAEWESDSVCFVKFDTLLRNAIQIHLEQRQINLKHWNSLGNWLIELSKLHPIWVPEFITQNPDDYQDYIQNNWEETTMSSNIMSTIDFTSDLPITGEPGYNPEP